MNKFEEAYLKIIKEQSYNNTIDEYKNLIEKAASLIKHVGMSDEELSDYMNEGSIKKLKQYTSRVDDDTWYNTVKYGWIVDSLPYVITCKDFKSYFENEDIAEFEDFLMQGGNFKHFFTNSFMNGYTEDFDWVKYIASQFPGVEIYKLDQPDEQIEECGDGCAAPPPPCDGLAGAPPPPPAPPAGANPPQPIPPPHPPRAGIHTRNVGALYVPTAPFGWWSRFKNTSTKKKRKKVRRKKKK